MTQYPPRTARPLPLLLVAALLAAAPFAALPLAAQPAGPADKSLAQYVLRTWGLDDGLPQLTVNALAQTPDGYVWIGTDDGLARFDGRRFDVFGHADTDAFSGSVLVRALHVDREGGLWIGTQESGLVRHAEGRFTAYGADHGLPVHHVTALAEDAAGRLWVGAIDGGLYVRRSGRFVRYDDAGLLAGRVVGTLHAQGDTLWVGTDDGLFTFGVDAPHRLAPLPGLPDATVVDLEGDGRGGLWVATRSGTAHVRDGRVRPHALPFPTLALTRAGGALWLGTDGAGLVRRTVTRDVLDRRTDFSNDRIRALLMDREGTLWIGTEGGGLAQLRDGRFTSYTVDEGLAANMVLTVFEDRRGALWAGTEGGGLTRFQNGRAVTFGTADGLTSDVVLSVAEDADGVLWAGTYGGGLHRFDGRRFVSVNGPGGVSSDAVFALHLGRSGTLWIGTSDGIAGYADGAFTRLTQADGLSTDAIASLYEGRDGTLWIGTVHGGLNRVRDGRVTHYGRADGLTSGTVSALYEDADGTLWVGTYGGGLFRFRDGDFTAVTDRAGLPSNNVLYVLEDDDGALWVTTSKGPFSARRADLDAFADGRRADLPHRVYGRHDGLRSVEMNGGVQPAGWRGRDGTLWFPTVAGVAGIHPRAARERAADPRMVIREVHVNGRPYDWRAGEPLAPGRTKIEIGYAALTYIAPEEVVYEYRLDGYDADWTSTPNRTVTYTNLAPGPYTFHVRARTHDGVVSAQPAVTSFYLEPFLWQTAWFRILAVLGAFALAGGAYRLRIAHLKARHRALEAEVAARTHDLRGAKERIERQNDELQELDRFKTRFFANISHEFRTPLTLMIGPLENALCGAYGRVTDDVQTQMHVMLRNALRLLRLINQLLDLSRLESGKLRLQVLARDAVPFLEGILVSFTAFAAQKGVELRFEAQEDAIPLFYEPDQLEKVFFNLLSNAVKFTPGGGVITLAVSVHPAPREDAPEGVVEVRVRDTGPGIPSEDLPFVFDRFRQVDASNSRHHEGTGIGLALVRELVLLHGGSVDVTSTLDEGTEFVVRLPRGAHHFAPDQILSAPFDGDDAQPAHGAMTELASADFNAMAHADDAPVRRCKEAPEDAPLVLIVDDSADLRTYVADCLRDRYRTVTAADGADGLERARALRPDVVISDIMMPRMNGYALCDALKSDEDLRHIPVILLSAKTSQEAINTSLEHGADEYLAKPFNGRELRARLRNLIALRAQERELKTLNEHLEARVQEQLDLILRERDVYEATLRVERDRAEEAARLKSAILNNMSHELRTPMTAIIGYAEIIAAEADEDLAGLADILYNNGKRLMDTLSGVMDLARLEAAAAVPEDEAVDVAAVAEAAAEAARAGARAKSLPIHFEPPAAPLYARFDRTALARVAGVLVDNAVKFTSEGEVRVEIVAQDASVGVRVRDTGIGIGADYLPDLFTPFVQESMGDARTFEGSGLNLTIAKRLVDLAGGRMEVETEQGVGSVFTAWLPRTLAPEAADAPGDGRLADEAPAVAVLHRTAPTS